MSKVCTRICTVLLLMGSSVPACAQDRGYVSQPNFNTVVPSQQPSAAPRPSAPLFKPEQEKSALPSPSSSVISEAAGKGPATGEIKTGQKVIGPTPSANKDKSNSAVKSPSWKAANADKTTAKPPSAKSPSQKITSGKIPSKAILAKTKPTKKKKARSLAAAKKAPAKKSSGDWQSTFITRLVGGDGTLLLINAPSTSMAKDISDTVNMDQAVSMALEHNPEIKAEIEKLRSRYWDKMTAYSQFLPVFQLDLATGRERSRPASYNDEFGNRVLDNWHHRRDRILTVRQPFVDLGYLSDIIGGHDREDLARIEQQDVQNTIASSTVNAYLSLIQSRISIRLADQYKGYLNKLAKQMRSRVEGGGASSADLDRILSRASLAETARVESEGDYQINLLELQRLTGVVPMKIKVPNIMAPAIPATIDEALTKAFQRNPAYQASLKKIDTAMDDRNRAFTGLAPRVYGQASKAYSYNPGGAANGNPIDGVYSSQRTDSVMVVAQWTINGGVPVTSGISAMAKARQASMESLDVREKMDQAIHISYTALETSRERIKVLQKTVRANERVVKGFEEQYRNGTRSVFELLDAYEQLYNSRLNLMRVVFAYTQASYQVRHQMGDIIPSIVSTRTEE